MEILTPETYSEEKFLATILESYTQYAKTLSSTSNTKVLPIHRYLAACLANIFPSSEFEIFYGDKERQKPSGGSYKRKSGNNKKGDLMMTHYQELEVEGAFYPKKIDVAVKKGNEVVFCLGFKFITSNYKQNKNNYFEGMLGETINIQEKKIPYAHILIFRGSIPYYKTGREFGGSEVFNMEDLQKYLALDNSDTVRPKAMAFLVVDFFRKKGEKETLITDDAAKKEDEEEIIIKNNSKNFENLDKFSMKNLLEVAKGYVNSPEKTQSEIEAETQTTPN